MRRRPVVLAAVAVVLALLVAGIVWSRSNPSGPGGRTTNQTSVPPAPTPSVAGLGPLATPGPGGSGASSAPGASASGRPADCGPWGCAFRRRLDAAAAVARTAPGRLGVTVLDRRTGAVWEAGTPGHLMWASSTPKLALATSLLERARAGEITLDPTARAQLAAMLAVSDDAAADALWDRYGGAAQLARFRDRYGMTGATFVPGFPQRWGFVKASARDLRRLMVHVLTRTDPADRAYLVAAMRGTGAIQHWGVWAAGPAQRPGVKDGWSVESDGGVEHWCTSSVGFAGPGERYVVAVMDDLPPGAGIAAGVHATSDVVATIFAVRTPAPVTVPPASTGR